MTSDRSNNIADIHRHLHSHLPSEPALRVKSLESLLVDKGIIDADAVDNWLESYTEKVGPMNGARVIARSWVDDEFRDFLERDALRAFQDLGLPGRDGYQLVAHFNTPTVHNLVVCTLCSCYPMGMIGIAPSWYKSAEYRARVVREPRAVLREFGVELDDQIQVSVWDSNSERRYIVIPERPGNTEGWSEEQLAKLVTRNSMIGTQRDLSPSPEQT
jgi:nitrile hydratase subunit alpha